MNKEELKKEVIRISDELDQSDGELLDLILSKIDEKTLQDTLTQLIEWETIEKLKRYFKKNTNDNPYSINIIRTPEGYSDEFTIIDGGKETPIEVVTRKVAINNELDFITDIKERNEFIKEIAEQEEPEEIGAYKRIETNLYYREF